MPGREVGALGPGVCPAVLSQTFTESPLLPSLPEHLWGAQPCPSPPGSSAVLHGRTPVPQFPPEQGAEQLPWLCASRSKESGTLPAFRGCSRGSQGRVWLLMAMTVPMTSAAAPRSTCCACAPSQGGVFPVPESPSE